MSDYFPFAIYLYLFIVFIIFIGIIVGIVAFINYLNNKNNMDSNQMKPKMSAKDFFLNLGAFISLYTLVGSLLGLLFNIIDTAYPKIQNGYNYLGSSSISWPVSTLVVFFPIFVLLMVFLERQYRVEPESQNSLVHRGLTYITLFISGCVMTGDLVTVVYYFIDGRELTTGFLLKVLVLLVISTSLFIYFISDLRKKLTAKLRMLWRIFSAVVIIVSIIWGFAVLGSPRTQRLIKYDEQKVSDLQNINNQITSYYSNQGTLPYNLEEMGNGNYYVAQVDSQNQKPYEYVKNSDTTYNLCAEFNKASDDKSNTAYPKYPSYGGNITWSHPAGHYCFNETINPNIYRNSPTPMPY